MNAVLMTAFEQGSLLEKLVQEITEANNGIPNPDDRIRLFQVPIERIV
ncbi:MAG: hypothetical protein M1470_05335 [Bacteroidetes bacterium]|nr:hypothetical protein [Bacteroidota bacterium]MCL5738547.1 hypothetical protein [Bacteroidota bacterium]